MKYFHSHNRREKSARGHNDPTELEYANGLDKKPDYKTAQLCKQTFRIVSQSLAGDCGDPLLQSLMVESVTPAPDARRLLVTVLATHCHTTESLAEIYHRLEQVKGLLRSAVAESICRKKAPDLAFVILPTVEAQP